MGTGSITELSLQPQFSQSYNQLERKQEKKHWEGGPHENQREIVEEGDQRVGDRKRGGEVLASDIGQIMLFYCVHV